MNVQYDNGFKIRVGVDPREALARQEAEVLQNYRDRRDNLYHSIDRQWEGSLSEHISYADCTYDYSIFIGDYKDDENTGRMSFVLSLIQSDSYKYPCYKDLGSLFQADTEWPEHKVLTFDGPFHFSVPESNAGNLTNNSEPRALCSQDRDHKYPERFINAQLIHEHCVANCSEITVGLEIVSAGGLVFRAKPNPFVEKVENGVALYMFPSR